MGGAKIDLATDFRDRLRAFVDHDVRFLIVGAYALAVLGRPRATGDLDVWVDPTPENADRAYAALREFGAPLHDLTPRDLAHPGVVFQIAAKPGDRVAAGDAVIILESMKMEIPVEAPRAGAVKAIKVHEGQTVQEGDVVAVLE